MSLQDLAPENTKRAQAIAVNVFKGFLASESTNLEFVHRTLLADSNGSAIVKLLDRFAMHLAFARGRGGELRKQNTVMSYYRNVKNWLLEDFPQHRHTIDQRLLKMRRILERYCLKRQQGGMVTKARACTKDDLRSLIDGLYYDACTGKEYQDAAPLYIMWYAFGRASDLAFLQKCNLSVSSGNVLFIRLIRAKTSEEQGLSLFPDKQSFITCPLHAMAMALAMQTFPAASVLDLEHLSTTSEDDEEPTGNSTPLTEALLHCEENVEPACTTSDTTPQRWKSATTKMQGYVNRVLKDASERQAKAGVSTVLSSHSFRRGGAQHANADSSLSPQWIFDRGSWNMTATNKAFAYVFNTTSEDRNVSKVLSDWNSDESLAIPNLASFDTATAARKRKLGRLVFASSLGLGDGSLTLDQAVADLLLASLIQHFPDINERYPLSPYTSPMRTCLFSIEVPMPELLAWSVQLNHEASKTCAEEEKTLAREFQLIIHQNAVIAQLLEADQAQTSRISELEKRMLVSGPAVHLDSAGDADTTREVTTPVDDQLKSGKKKMRSASKPASATWYEWYTKTPRLWEVCDDRQYKSQSKQIVAFMKLFLPGGFTLDPSADDYGDRVLQAGNAAQKNLGAFLKERGLKRKFGSGLLKQYTAMELYNSLLPTIESAQRFG